MSAATHRRPLLLVLVGLAALAVPACANESDEAATEAATVAPSSAPTDATTSLPIPTEPPATEPPATEPPATEPPATDSVDVASSAAEATEPIVLTPGDPVKLHTGEVVRFETEGADFELAGHDGWVAFVSPLSTWITTSPDLGRAWVSVLHLKNGHPELGADADLSGVAIPADPRVDIADLLLPDGSPNLTSLLPLPDDWFGYLASLPGLTVGAPSPTSFGQITGDAVTYEVEEMSDAPQPFCANGLLAWVELESSWCLVEGEVGTILVAEADGERFELNVGTNEHATADDEAALAEVLASLRMV